MTEQTKQPQETERERYTVDQIKQQIAEGVLSEHVVVDMVAHYDAMQQNRDMYRTLAGIGAWHSDCRPNREMAARELQKSQAVIDKLADEIADKNRAYDAMQQERDEWQAIALANGQRAHDADVERDENAQLWAAMKIRTEAAEATVARLVMALRDFGRHLDSCATRKPRTLHFCLGQDFAETLPPANAVCNCGFGAALTESPTPAPEGGR